MLRPSELSSLLVFAAATAIPDHWGLCYAYVFFMASGRCLYREESHGVMGLLNVLTILMTRSCFTGNGFQAMQP